MVGVRSGSNCVYEPWWQMMLKFTLTNVLYFVIAERFYGKWDHKAWNLSRMQIAERATCNDFY